MRKTNEKYYLYKHRMSSLVMIVMLSWLTVCTPFVFAQQQQQKAAQQVSQQQEEEAEEECSNPLSNTNEEKTGNGLNSFNEEYLHEAYESTHHFTLVIKFYKGHPLNTYIDFHPEQFSPPPEQVA